MNAPVKPSRIPASRFTRDNSGASSSLPYPFKHIAPFVNKLDLGWRTVGWASNDDLSPDIRRLNEGGPYIAIMFTDPEGFDVWFHFGDYPYQFIET